MNNIALVVTKVFDATPEELFDAWTDPKQVAQWYGPEGFADSDIHTFEVKEGGVYSLTMNAPDGTKHKLRGVFKEIDKPNKLVLTWQWENGEANDGMDMGVETLVTVEFKALGDKTEMHFVHSGFTSEEIKESHNKGWSSSFNKLEKLLS